MDLHQFNAVNNELERYDCMLIASEDWSGEYGKDEDSHARLIKNEAKLAKDLRRWLKELAERAPLMVHWNAYQAVKADYNVEVIVNDEPIATAEQTFITVMFDSLAVATSLGAQGGEAIYKVPLGIQSTDAIIQELTTKQVAFLVGRKVDQSGKLIDNPNSKYSVTETIRNDVKKSVQTSINLGEDRAAATARLQTTIKNPRRAATIAQTETVNAYANGLLEFGRQSGATGKEWQDVGAVDVCAMYGHTGVVELRYAYDGRFIQGPAAHPNCRCGLRLVYPNE